MSRACRDARYLSTSPHVDNIGYHITGAWVFFWWVCDATQASSCPPRLAPLNSSTSLVLSSFFVICRNVEQEERDARFGGSSSKSRQTKQSALNFHVNRTYIPFMSFFSFHDGVLSPNPSRWRVNEVLAKLINKEPVRQCTGMVSIYVAYLRKMKLSSTISLDQSIALHHAHFVCYLRFVCVCFFQFCADLNRRRESREMVPWDVRGRHLGAPQRLRFEGAQFVPAAEWSYAFVCLLAFCCDSQAHQFLWHRIIKHSRERNMHYFPPQPSDRTVPSRIPLENI